MAGSKTHPSGRELVELIYELRDDFGIIDELIRDGKNAKAAAIARDAMADIKANWRIVKIAAMTLDKKKR